MSFNNDKLSSLIIDMSNDFSNSFGIYFAVATLFNAFYERRLCEFKTPIEMYFGYLKGAYIGYLWPITFPIIIIRQTYKK